MGRQTSRAALYASTALAVLAARAHAQLAPTARPAGGQISAGQATIGGNATTTTINQSSQNAAINWQTYNVGSGQTVQYNQPNAASFTLNRVIAAQPSQIAGHITANGQIAIVNQSGVVFLQGATVDTSGLVVSAAGITDADFMAGRLIFGAPARAGAAISNAGNITVRQAGLAALVAPQVRNSGTITAQLGRVILGGATTHTLDMYGDGLVALNVTGQVTQVQVGGHPVTALVTNTGTILAPGGTVVLTARAADGVVSTAVSAGGTIAAPTVGGQAGRVLVSGIGGDVEVDGAVSATGSTASGGRIAVASDHRVMIADGALLDSSGATGGGTLAIGTTAGVLSGRATIATATTIAPSATVRARAVRAGRGGRIAIASSGATSVQGAVTAQGGDISGDGGTVSLAGASVDIPGAITTRAAHGLTGILGITGPGGGAPLYIGDACAAGKTCTAWESLAGQAANNLLGISNAGDIDLLFNHAATTNGFSTTAISLAITTTAVTGHTSDVNIDAGVSLITPALSITSAGAINLNTALGTPNATTGATFLDAATSTTFSAAGNISAGPVAPNGSDKGELITGLLAITSARSVELDASGNSINTLAGISDTAAATAISGTVTLIDNASLSVSAPISATGSVSITVTGSDTIPGSSHSLFIPATALAGNTRIPVSLAGNGVTLVAAGGIDIGATANAGAGTLSFDAQGGDLTASGALTAGVLAAHATGDVSVTSATNAFASIGSGAGTVSGLVSDDGAVIADDAVSLAINRAIAAQGIVAVNVTTPNGVAPHTLNDAAAISGEQITLATTGGTAATPGTVLTLGGSLTATGNSDQRGTISLQAGLGDILLESTLQAGTAAASIFNGATLLQATEGGIAEAAGGAIHAGTLSATATANIVLAQSGNQIATLGRVGRSLFAVSAGPTFSLTDGQNLDVVSLASATGLLRLEIDAAAPSTLTVDNSEGGIGTLSLAGAGTIALVADHFNLDGVVTVPGGLVALDVAHAGAFTVVDTGGTIDPASLADITATTLALGSQDGATAGHTTNLTIDTGSAAGPTVLDLTTVASTLALYASGAITEENPGAVALGLSGISVGTVRGHAGQAIGLNSASNSIGTIAGLVSDASSVTVADVGSLDVTGAISALGTVAVDVSPFPANFANVATLTIGANVTGSNVTLASAPANGELAAAPAATIDVQSGATIATTAGTGTLALTTAIGDISLAGTLSRAASVTLTASGGSIVEQSTGAIGAGTLTAGAQRGMLASGAVIGGAIDLATGTTAAGAAPLNQVATLASLTAADSITFTDNAVLTVAGPVTATAGTVALAVDTQAGRATANTLSVGATTIAGTSVALSTTGSATAAPATAITLAAGSTLTATSTTAGTIGLAALAGDIALNGTLTGLAAGAAPFAESVALNATTGNITEGAAGAIRAAHFAASAHGNITLAAASGTLSGAPIGNQIAQTGTTIGALTGIATLDNLTLVDGTPLTITGPVSAQLQAAIVTPTLTITSAGSLTAATGGKILLAANEYQIGGTITATDGLVALGLLTAGTFSVIAGSATANDEIGAADLAHITAGTLALGSTDGFSADGNTASASTWTASTAGSVALLQLTAPLNSAFPTLGLFSNGAILATGANSITATALYGQASTGITLDATTNSIGTLAALAHAAATPQDSFALGTTQNSITLQDAHTLFAEGSVSAPDTVAITVTGLASAAAPNALHLDSFLNGQTITLATTGTGATGTNLPQIITFGASSQSVALGTISVNAAQGDIDIAGFIQATLGQKAEFRALAGNIYETDAAFDTPSAGTIPTGHFLVSRLAAQAGSLEGGRLYSVILDSTQNILNDVVGFPTGGATQVSSATDTFSLYDNLSFNVDAGVHLEAGNSGIAGHPGLLSLTTGLGIEIDGTVQAGNLATSAAGTAAYAGSLILGTRISDITETAGASVLAGTLAAASTAGGVLLNTAGATNVIATLAGVNTAHTNFRLHDSALVAPGVFLPGRDLLVTDAVSVQTGSLILAVSQGNLTFDNTSHVTAGARADLSADLGILQLGGAITAANVSLTAGGAIAQLAATSITATGAAGDTPSIVMSAGGGAANDVILPDGHVISLFGIALGGTDTAGLGTGAHPTGSITLISPLGDISQTAPSDATIAPPSTTPPVATGILTTGTLSFQAGTSGSASATPYNVWLDTPSNSIATLSGIGAQPVSSATGSIVLMDGSALTIAAGALVQAANAASLPSAITLQDHDAIAIDGTLQAGILASFATGTATYTGALSLTADNNSIAEGTAGRILASSLLVDATQGSVTLLGAGNTVATLLGPSIAGFDFAFADDALVSTGVTLPGQDVFVTGAVRAGDALSLSVAHGNLNLELGSNLLALTAGTTETLAADIGIRQFAGQISGGTVAITAGAEFAQLGGGITATGITNQTVPVAPTLTVTAGGGSANDVTLANGDVVSIFGIALGGTNMAGAPTSAGRATLIAEVGGITEHVPDLATLGTLETGTLAFQAGSFESASSTLFSAILSGSNAIGTLSGLIFGGHTFAASSATGSIALFDSAALTIAAATRIEAGNTASLPSALSIEDQASLSILGTLQSGTIHATDSTHGTYTGILQLQADAGSITEASTAALLADSLNVTAPAGAVALATAGNAVATLTGADTAGTSFTFQDSATLPGGLKLPHQDVTIAGSIAADAGALALDVTGGNLVLDGPAVTATTTATLAADLGIVQNATAIAAGTVAITAGAEFAQFQNAAITATGIPGAGGAAPLLSITAGGGFSNDVILSNGTTISLFGIALGGSNQAASATAPGSIRLLSPAGDITEAAPGTPATTAVGQLLATNLAFQAGTPGTGSAVFNAWLNHSTNRIGTLTGIATTIDGTTTQLSGATGTLSIADAGSLTLAATTVLDAANTAAHPTAATLQTQGGAITLAGTLAAADVNLNTIDGAITETTGHIISDRLSFEAATLDYPTVFNVTLNNASNAIGTLTGAPASPGVPSYASGNLSVVDSIGLTIAAGATIEAGANSFLSLHTLSGPISIAGTLSYARIGLDDRLGVVTLSADAGNITETTAASRLFASELTADAPAGAVTLGSAGNFVTSLVGRNTAQGGFTLTDAAAAQPGQNVFINGAITASDIALTVTGGNLNLETLANLTAGTDTLTADLGILQYGGTVIGHTVLLSAGTEIAQFAHGSISGTPSVVAGHQFSSSVTLHAGTKNAAGGFANDVVLPDGHTITLNGIALGGLVSATGEGVSNIDLITPGGDITQTAPNDATTGTTIAPPAATGTLITDYLQFQAGTKPAARAGASSNAWLDAKSNRIGTLGGGSIGAARAIDVVDSEDLTLQGFTTLSANSSITLSLAGHTLTQQGNAGQPGGDILQAGGAVVINAALLTQQAGALLSAGLGATVTGNVTQTGATFTAGQSVTIDGTLTQSAASALTATGGRVAISGALSQTLSALNAGLAVVIGKDATQTTGTLTAHNSVIVQGGLTQLTNSTLIAATGGLSVTGALSQTASALTAGKSVTIGGAATQSAGTLTAGAGSVTIGGALGQSAHSTLAAGTSVTVTGAATQSLSLLTAGAGATFDSALAQTTSTLAAGADVLAAGGLTQNGSTLTAQTGTITIRGTLTQTNASLLQARAGGIAIGQSAAQDASAVLAATSVTIGAALTQVDTSTLTATAGSVTIGGGATQTGSVLTAGANVAITGPLTQTSSALTAGQAVSVTGDTTQSASHFTAAAGDIALGGTLTQAAASTLTASGNVTITGNAAQTGSTLTAAGGSVGIGGNLDQDHSALAAGQSVAIGGSLTQTDSTLSAGAGNISIGGLLAQTTSSLTAGQSVIITGSVTQSASTLTATGGSVTIGGLLAQATSSLSAGQSVAVTGGATQSGSTLTATAGSITIGGALSQGTSTLTAGQSVTITGDATQSASALTAAGVSITGSLTQTGSTLLAADDVGVGAALDQTSSSTLTTGGQITVIGDALQSAGSSISTLGQLGNGTGGLTVDGSLRQGGSQITLGGLLTVGASLTQDSSTLRAGTQIDQLGGQDITLSGAGSLTQANGSTITSHAGIGAALSGGFAQDATSLLYANGDIHFAATTGNIAFEGILQAGQLQPDITLIAQSGDIVSNGGTLNAYLLAAQASGRIALDGTANIFGRVTTQTVGTMRLAGLQAGGSLSVRDSTKLILDNATLSGTSVTLQTPGATLTQQGGNITATAGDLAILAGNLSQDAAGTLSAIAGNLQISAPGTLGFAGLLEAPRILLGEHANGTTLIQDSAAPAEIDFTGGTILTDSAIPIVPGAQPDILTPITSGADAALGLFATATNITQTGTTRVQTLSSERRQTVQFRLTGPAGTVAFDPVNSTASGLFGPETQLLLDLRIKGLAIGNIVVAGLNLYYGGTVASPLGKASLTGSVNGRTGTAAASTGFIHTSPGVNYQFNACPIQSLNCVLLSPFVVPLGSPVRDLEVSVGHRREDDDDLILPNVAEQDY